MYKTTFIFIISIILIFLFSKNKEKYTDLWDANKAKADIQKVTGGLFNGIKSFIEGAVTVFSPKIPGKKPCSDWNSRYRDDGTSCWLDTYGRGAGRIPDKRGCDNGQRDDGTSCWEDAKCETKCSGDWRPWTWHCDTNCTGCACIKKTLGQRQTCRGDEEMKDGLCYSKCAPGYHTVGCCLCEPDGGPGIRKTAFDRYQCPPPGAPDYKNLRGALCYK